MTASLDMEEVIEEARLDHLLFILPPRGHIRGAQGPPPSTAARHRGRWALDQSLNDEDSQGQLLNLPQLKLEQRGEKDEHMLHQIWLPRSSALLPNLHGEQRPTPSIYTMDVGASSQALLDYNAAREGLGTTRSCEMRSRLL
jgi:hypothetical protein